MIPLTRLRHGNTLYLNPDLFERVDTHVDTVIRLIDGTEYVVVEPAEEIVRRIVEFRARIIVIATVLQSTAFAPPTDESNADPEHATTHLAELAGPADQSKAPTAPPAAGVTEDGA